MLKMGILEPIESLARVGLDPKAKRDGETERYCLLAIANIAVSSENHKQLLPVKAFIDAGPLAASKVAQPLGPLSIFYIFSLARCLKQKKPKWKGGA